MRGSTGWLPVDPRRAARGGISWLVLPAAAAKRPTKNVIRVTSGAEQLKFV